MTIERGKKSHRPNGFSRFCLGPETEPLETDGSGMASIVRRPSLSTRPGPPRATVLHIMDTFPIVKREDEAAHGIYRTKDTILEIYDALAESIRTGQPYQTSLDQPPADSRCCHPPRHPLA